MEQWGTFKLWTLIINIIREALQEAILSCFKCVEDKDSIVFDDPGSLNRYEFRKKDN